MHKILPIKKIDATIAEYLFIFDLLLNMNEKIINMIPNNGESNWLSVGVPIIGLKQETIEDAVKLIPKISLTFTFVLYLLNYTRTFSVWFKCKSLLFEVINLKLF